LTSSIPKKARALVRWLWISFLYATGLLWWAKRRLAAQGGIVVLTFHRVLPDAEFARTNSPKGMAVRQRTFACLAEHLARHCAVIPLGEDDPVWARGASKPRVALTFDDGWADNATAVFPINRQRGLPWTIFICPERVGRHFPYWPERVFALWRAAERRGVMGRLLEAFANGANHKPGGAHRPREGQMAESVIERLKTLSPEERDLAIGRMKEAVDVTGDAMAGSDSFIDATMRWREIEALASRGVTFGSHTLSHPILTGVPRSEAQQEIAGSKLAIEQKLRRECRLFAYPNGDWSAEVRQLVAEAGYELAFANRPGAWTRDTDRFVIPRTNIWEGSLVGPSGRFSRLAFEYAAFWKAVRAEKAWPARPRGQETTTVDSPGAGGKRAFPRTPNQSVERRG
jgi:peptidoglycan/xylan/chitin deacetylase (PgdA/CDA1 family)